MIKYKYSLDSEEMGIDHQDSGPWMSYELTFHGNSLEECLENAYVSLLDQDGGDINTYKYSDYCNESADRAVQMIKDHISLIDGEKQNEV